MIQCAMRQSQLKVSKSCYKILFQCDTICLYIKIKLHTHRGNKSAYTLNNEFTTMTFDHNIKIHNDTFVLIWI